MSVILLILLLIVLIIKKPSFIETFSNFTATKDRYMDYTNYLCNTRVNCDSCKERCISVPLVNQRPQNTHPNSVKPIKFVTW